MKKAFVRNIEELTIPFDEIKTLSAHKSISLDKKKFNKKHNLKKNIKDKNLPSVAISAINSFDYVMPGLGIAKAISDSNKIGNLYGFAYGPYDTGAVKNRFI